MLSKYFKFKVKTQDFIDNLKTVIENLKDKKVLVCGETKSFFELDKLFALSKKLNIVAFAKTDEKDKKLIRNIKTINMGNIKDEIFDSILITGENSEKIYNKLYYKYGFENAEMLVLFKENKEEGYKNLIYLLKHNFDRTLPKLIRKLKNKTVLIYGAGIFFELINKYFDLSGLNIIGIADQKFMVTSIEKEYLGYKTYKPEDIKKLKPDYLLITLKRTTTPWEGLYFNYLDKTKTKIISCVRKNIFEKFMDLSNN